MGTIEAMDKVNGLLADEQIKRAQEAVIEIEKSCCTLPSSVFERVLRVSIAHGALTQEYEGWCRRSFGRKQYEHLVRGLAREGSRL